MIGSGWVKERLGRVRGRLGRRWARTRAKSPLEKYFRADTGRLIHKWVHYFDIYHRHFQRFRGRPVVILEFGVSQGGSLQMWRDYFGPKAMIYGVDIDPRCARLAGLRMKVFIGDQEDREFLRTIAAEIGPIDILVEDGGHTMGQQIATFEELTLTSRPMGCLLSRMSTPATGSATVGATANQARSWSMQKGSLDQLNAWHSREKGFAVDEFTRTTRSMHFYDSIVVFERGVVVKPHAERMGKRSFRRAE